MRAVDGKSFTNISATTATFNLAGGIYAADYIATWGGGSVTLQKQAADGSTLVTAATAWNANGFTSPMYLPQGVYKLAVATATAVYVCIRRVQGE